MARFVALLRGINVGTAKSISMADLTAVFEGLGFTGVTTVLRSGNVVFDSETPDAARPAALEQAVLSATGVQSSVLVIEAADFRAIAAANPLTDISASVSNGGSRSFVTFLSSDPGEFEVPDAAALAPEILALGRRALYQWIPDGSLQTKVPPAFWKQFTTPVTTRNLNTVTKLLALLDRA